MKPFRPERAATRRGFTRWIKPVMRGYLMACCDCGLVHELEFVALEAGPEDRYGRWVGRKLARGKWRVAFRARRAEGHTRRQRVGKKLRRSP